MEAFLVSAMLVTLVMALTVKVYLYIFSELCWQTFSLDIDECIDADQNNCDMERGNCTNTVGSFNCTCNAGYSGDGVVCMSEYNIEYALSQK